MDRGLHTTPAPNRQLSANPQHHVDVAVISPLFEAIEKDDINYTKSYFEQDCSSDRVNICNKDGDTPLIKAIKEEKVEIIRYLVKKLSVADINHRSKSGFTALMCAAKVGNYELVQSLVEQGHADDDTAFESIEAGCTALHYAAEKGFTTIVHYLIVFGHINVNIRNFKGYTALHIAAKNGNFDLVRCILTNANNIVDTNLQTQDGHSALIIATKKGHIQILKLLADRKQTDKNIRNKTKGFTALHYATKHDNTDLVKYFVEECHANVNLRCNNGNTPLIMAAELNNFDMVLIMVNQGQADINAINKEGRSALYFAAKNNNSPMIKFLLSFGNVNFGLHFPRCIPDTVDGEGKEILKLWNKCNGPRATCNTIHVHFVGDGKAGKSMAIQWMVRLLQGENAEKKLKATIDLSTGRTRGIQTTTVTIKVPPSKHHHHHHHHHHADEDTTITYILHDYGGQEEFLSNHANFMTVSHSFYVIVVPLVHVEDEVINTSRLNEEVDGTTNNQHHDTPNYRIRTATEILDRYLYWLRFIFSVLRKEDAFPRITSSIHQTLQSLDALAASSGMNSNTSTQYNGWNASPQSIPLITLINKFSDLIGPDKANNHAIGVKQVLRFQLENLFSVKNRELLAIAKSKEEREKQKHLIRLLPPIDYDFIMPDDDFLVLDNNINQDMEHLVYTIQTMMSHHHHVVAKDHYSMLVEHITNQYANPSRKPALFMKESEWQIWLTTSIKSFPFGYDCHSKLLDTSIEIMNGLYKHCENALLACSRVLKLNNDVNGYKVVTNPSALSCAIVGDLMWWFHYHNQHNHQRLHSTLLSSLSISQSTDNVNNTSGVMKPSLSLATLSSQSTDITSSIGQYGGFDIKTLQLTQSSIIEKLQEVHRAKFPSNNKDDRAIMHKGGFITFKRHATIHPTAGASGGPSGPVTGGEYATAISVLDSMKGGFTSFPLVDLLNKMGMALEIYDDNVSKRKSWLVGLAPNFPKGHAELHYNFSLSGSSNHHQQHIPDHEVRRYFRLPDTRSGFIPGFFLKLFVFMVNNRKYQMEEGYGNAARLNKRLNDNKNEIQFLICQLPHKDNDAFIVSVGGQGPQALENCINELNIFRRFLYSDCWGFSFQEYCLHIEDNDHIVPQRHVFVREFLLEGMEAIDEIEPRLFGIPSMVETYCMDGEDTDKSSVQPSKTSAVLSALVGMKRVGESKVASVSKESALVHGDCMASRMNAVELYFGKMRTMVAEPHAHRPATAAAAFHTVKTKQNSVAPSPAKPIPAGGIMSADRRPTEIQKLQGNHLHKTLIGGLGHHEMSHEAMKDRSERLATFAERCSQIKLTLSVSDIYQRYEESCYDDEEIIQLAARCNSIAEVVKAIKTHFMNVQLEASESVSSEPTSESDQSGGYFDEAIVREALFRSLKSSAALSMLNHVKTLHNNIGASANSSKLNSSGVVAIGGVEQLFDMTLSEFDKEIQSIVFSISSNSVKRRRLLKQAAVMVAFTKIHIQSGYDNTETMKSPTSGGHNKEEELKSTIKKSANNIHHNDSSDDSDFSEDGDDWYNPQILDTMNSTIGR